MNLLLNQTCIPNTVLSFIWVLSCRVGKYIDLPESYCIFQNLYHSFFLRRDLLTSINRKLKPWKHYHSLLAANLQHTHWSSLRKYYLLKILSTCSWHKMRTINTYKRTLTLFVVQNAYNQYKRTFPLLVVQHS